MIYNLKITPALNGKLSGYILSLVPIKIAEILQFENTILVFKLIADQTFCLQKVFVLRTFLLTFTQKDSSEFLVKQRAKCKEQWAKSFPSFISSRSQVFGLTDVLKTLRKIGWKTHVLDCIVNKVAGLPFPVCTFN